jgi:hypothetical protein
MLAAVPGNSAALRQHYNVCSDRSISFVGEAVGLVVEPLPCDNNNALRQQHIVTATAAYDCTHQHAHNNNTQS